MLRRHFDRLQYLDYLIGIKATGNPEILASRLNISRSSLFELLQFMKELGAPIAYNRQRRTYYYKEAGKLELHFQAS